MPKPCAETIELKSENLPLLKHHGSPSASIVLPTYDRSELRGGIVHIGVGGFHRAHLAMYADDLCWKGLTGWGIVGSGVLPGDTAMASALAAQDHLYTLIVRGNSATEGRVIGSIIDYLHAHPDNGALVDRVAHPDTQIVSMTITEGGYPVSDSTGAYDPDSSLGGRDSAFGIIAAGLDKRRLAGAGPLTVMSCDNIVGNGKIARAATLGEAAQISDELVDWINTNVSFPNSMVDRITPATTDDDVRWLAQSVGIDDRWPVFTEPFTLWVVEDDFAGERLPLEEIDVVIVDDVEPFEQMKLRLLNAGHSTIAYLAALIGHEFVHDAIAEPEIHRYLDGFLRYEARPVLPSVPGYDVDGFQSELVDRFANPAIADQISRLCLDGSVKFPKFLLPTIEDQLAADGPIELSALALAGWLRYLTEPQAEAGSMVHVADDPNRAEAIRRANEIGDDPAEFLRWSTVFGELATSARFAQSFRKAHRRLADEGVRAAIASALDIVEASST